MERISNKSKDVLWNTIDKEVTDARINIAKLKINDKFIEDQIDRIMFNLQCGACQKAIDCFITNRDK